MPPQPLPEIQIDTDLSRDVASLAGSFESLDEAERRGLEADLAAPLRGLEPWQAFCEQVRASIAASGYLVVRGLGADGGRSLLVASCALGAPFDTYRPGRIVKRFRMSPWTQELSHTTRAGDFHTDGNVSSSPPCCTVLQCEIEDPGAPEYAEQRVAFLPDLLARLRTGDPQDTAALTFLTESEVSLAQEHSSEIWRGKLVKDGTIRYHPASLRVANERSKAHESELETVIETIHRAAMDVSVPFHTRPGDTVLMSNRAALHYRGACSVRFTRFPTEFESRCVLVLHLREPLA